MTESDNWIVIRLQRTRMEHALVKVPVTEDLISDAADGSQQLDPGKLIHRALELGAAEDVKWTKSHQQIEPHMIQPGSRPSSNSAT